MTTKTSSVRGPWTPSTRSSSMSDVAEGPETNVIGRPSAAAAGGGGDGVGHRRDDRRRIDDADVAVRDERQRTAAGPGTAVEDDRARVGDRQRGAGDDGVERVELGGRKLVVLDDVDADRREDRRDADARG